MKRYIKSSSTEGKKEFHTSINITMIYELLVHNSGVAATTYKFDSNLFPKELLEETMLNYEDFIDSINNLAVSRGFHEVESHKKSPYSKSEYFVFCLENDYVKCTVEMFCCLRVSNHYNTKTDNYDPEATQKSWYRYHLNSEYRKLNNLLNEKYIEEELTAEDENRPMDMLKIEDIEVELRTVKIDDDEYTTIGESLGKVDKALQELKADAIAFTDSVRKNRTNQGDK